MRWLATEHEWARESPHVWVRELSRGSAGIGAPAKDAHPRAPALAADKIGLSDEGAWGQACRQDLPQAVDAPFRRESPHEWVQNPSRGPVGVRAPAEDAHPRILTLASDEFDQLDEDAGGQTCRKGMSQAADEPLGRQAPTRGNFPLTLSLAEAGKESARQTTILTESEALARRAANRDAAAMRSPRDPWSRLVWEPRHEWLGPTVPWASHTPFPVMAVGALPRIGGYPGGADYISAAGVPSRDCDHAEYPPFEHAVRKAVQATERDRPAEADHRSAAAALGRAPRLRHAVGEGRPR